MKHEVHSLHYCMSILVVMENSTVLCAGSDGTRTALGDPSRTKLNFSEIGGVIFLGLRTDPLHWIYRWNINGRLPIAIIAETDEVDASVTETPLRSDHAPVWARLHAQLGQRSCGKVRYFRIDQRAREVSLGMQRMMCSPMEFRLLVFFLRYPDVVFSRTALLRRISGATDSAKPQIVDVLVRRLRDKVEFKNSRPEHIQAVRGIGYVFRHNGDVFLDSLTQQLFLSWPPQTVPVESEEARSR
jgi:DNA-binding winged helix-turn-helix (wHTH) protein